MGISEAKTLQAIVSKTTYTSKTFQKYYGPYEISQKIGAVAYKIDLPSNTKIHLAFHVSLLKPNTGDLPQSPTTI